MSFNSGGKTILDNGLERLGVADDFRKAKIVMKYEMKKFLSGKKILIFGIMVLAILIVMTVVEIAYAKDVTSESFCSTLVNFTAIVALIGATLFSSVTLVSEFEERTALVLFTKPISKASIFVGKFLAAYILNIGTMVIYYILTAIICAIYTHGVPIALGASLVYLAAYVFTVTGIAMLFSSFLKKSSTSSILTFVFLFLVFPVLESVVAIATGGINMETGEVTTCWYFPDVAATAVINCISKVYTDGWRDFFVMFLWGLFPTIGSYIIFKRRAF